MVGMAVLYKLRQNGETGEYKWDQRQRHRWKVLRRRERDKDGKGGVRGHVKQAEWDISLGELGENAQQSVGCASSRFLCVSAFVSQQVALLLFAGFHFLVLFGCDSANYTIKS
ncbi:hypothetical protein L6164_024353 [Bauhinia variegata]|uniref:Uncharacterized protein n=1 Tax=Bauhinia variegata TaxID=167791 RepID=A0ACB9LYN9_BAUVA|nr:hypothetical protein L6164_024353 [Bauhinia variegata]